MAVGTLLAVEIGITRPCQCDRGIHTEDKEQHQHLHLPDLLVLIAKNAENTIQIHRQVRDDIKLRHSV